MRQEFDGGEFGRAVFLRVEGEDGDAVAGAQGVYEGVGGAADEADFGARRTGSVEHERDFEGRVGGDEVGDALRLAVFVEGEIFGAQIRERSPGAIRHRHGHGDELRVHAHHVVFVNFFPAGDGTLRRRRRQRRRRRRLLRGRRVSGTDAARSLFRRALRRRGLRRLLRERDLELSGGEREQEQSEQRGLPRAFLL